MAPTNAISKQILNFKVIYACAGVVFLVLDCNIFLPFKIIKKENHPFIKKKKTESLFVLTFSISFFFFFL